jgi:DNA-binding NarL/FixJ family response regulator
VKKVHVLLADDHAIFREGLRMLLSLEKDLDVIGEADNGADTVRLAKWLKPDVVVMDIGMPNLNGIEATREILETAPDVRVLGLSAHKDRRFVMGMLGAGAKGYLLKDCAGEELVRAIRDVMGDRIYVSSQISGVVVGDYVRQVQSSGEPSLLSLTAREREVMRLLALGRHNKQIAASLGLSEKTVETHRQHMMEKLGLHSIADLTRFAIREGLVSSEE